MTVEIEKVWFESIRRFLESGDYLREDEQLMRVKSARYVLIGKVLYRLGYSRPLLRCVTHNQA